MKPASCSRCSRSLLAEESVEREYISVDSKCSVFHKGHYATDGEFVPDESIRFGHQDPDMSRYDFLKDSCSNCRQRTRLLPGSFCA